MADYIGYIAVKSEEEIVALSGLLVEISGRGKALKI